MAAFENGNTINAQEDDEAEEQALAEYDQTYETDIVRAKWVMDEATTLAEAADRLVAFAEELRAMERDGWQLNTPVEDDYGHIERLRKQ